MKLSSSLFFAAAFMALGAAVPAQAALLKQAWVSGHGTNSASCGASTSPCRTFQYAVTNRVSAGGQIAVLDAADYGPVTITSSLSIVNDSAGVATIRQTAADPAITITLAATGKVSLRGLTLDGTGVGTDGIRFNSGASLDIANCVVRHFKSNGINLMPTTTSTFSVADTVVSGNTNAGVVFFPQGTAGLTGLVNGVTAINNYDGITLSALASTASATLDVTVVNSVAANNSDAGFNSDSDVGHPVASMFLRNVVASNNETGVAVTGSGAVAWIAHSIVDGNNFGTRVYNGSAALYIYGNSNFTNNHSKFSGDGPVAVLSE